MNYVNRTLKKVVFVGIVALSFLSAQALVLRQPRVSEWQALFEVSFVEKKSNREVLFIEWLNNLPVESPKGEPSKRLFMLILDSLIGAIDTNTTHCLDPELTGYLRLFKQHQVALRWINRELNNLFEVKDSNVLGLDEEELNQQINDQVAQLLMLWDVRVGAQRR